ncbi:MAG TPA: protein translocase subunit SecF [Candidatus Heimdallarchaeota archaeon]|nr:protein translocase subunit SecF [Candidatus Heimdallarchaeota archaeon]
MQIFKKPNFNFMKYKYVALGFSAIIIIIGLLNINFGKGLTPGIDFAGGALVRIKFSEPMPVSDIRQALAMADLGASKIQAVGDTQTEYMIRTMQATEDEQQNQDIEAHEIMSQRVVDVLRGEDEKAALDSGKVDLNSVDEGVLSRLIATDFPDEAEDSARRIIAFRVANGIIAGYEQIEQEVGISSDIVRSLQAKTILSRLAVLSRESVGPQVGFDLRRKATQATVWALIGMLIYIGIRFKFAYGVAAILTLTHDVLVTIGIFSLTNREINLPVIAAILTIVGYSLNDTIVIFDRVRDNIKILRKKEFEQLLDASINQTLSRTIITSGTTFFTVAALFFFGGKVINDFAFTMMIGVIVGTYSSIYQSCSILFFWKKFFKPKKGMGK